MQNPIPSRTYPKSLNPLTPLTPLTGEQVKGVKGVKGLKGLAVLEKMRTAGFEMFADGERLRWRGPSDVLTDDDRAAIAANKPELLWLLAQSTLPLQTPRGFHLTASELPEYQAAVDALDECRETSEQRAVMSLPERYTHPKGAE